MKILILGVNGFIGNSLVKRIMDTTDWEVYGMDLSCHKLSHSLANPRFKYIEGDISINKEWIEYHVKKCDVVLPLVAIATPKAYVERPLEVFGIDFEENLKVIRYCVKYRKRVIFPSTSEVYGMCTDPEFDEEKSQLVLGPIHKQRWIYSCSKQLMDRVIWAYGAQQKLQFTLIRPFNWIGPKLDDIDSALEGSSRVVTQFIINLVKREPINLVDGGSQKRCFTYVEDGIDCLMEIIKNSDNRCDGQIFNIGAPANECSVKELAERLLGLFQAHPDHAHDPVYSDIIGTSHQDYYGKDYEDILYRRPSIQKARDILGWEPRTSLDDALKYTLDFFLEEIKAMGDDAKVQPRCA
ncbi:MAG: bifunctional UDP-4-keto-pentose/UDP-xylose synthase [Deltaproteobacteria bacterium]|nr:bifunctional UDP-4-keto-pentose/UDP-xylose synthase [Deltaproteobacteria bacterium]